MLDDPFMLMLNVASQNKSPASMYIDGVLNSTDKSYITRDIEAMKDQIMDAMGSKFVMYKNTVLWLVLASCLSTMKSLVYYKYTMDFLS